MGAATGPGVTVSGITIEGTGAAAFAIDWSKGSIAVGEYRNMKVTFSGSSDAEAVLVIRHNSGGGVDRVRLTAKVGGGTRVEDAHRPGAKSANILYNTGYYRVRSGGAWVDLKGRRAPAEPAF